MDRQPVGFSTRPFVGSLPQYPELEKTISKNQHLICKLLFCFQTPLRPFRCLQFTAVELEPGPTQARIYISTTLGGLLPG